MMSEDTKAKAEKFPAFALYLADPRGFGTPFNR
jgi:hypothetical protein